MLLVVVWRIITHLCCQPRDRAEIIHLPVVADVEMGTHAKTPLVPIIGSTPGIPKNVDVNRVKDEQMQIGWMTEAKDWAGELISGQSMVK